MTACLRIVVLIAVVASLLPTGASVAAEGELRWGLHVTLAPKWLDPAETEAFNTPYMVMYAIHDAMVKPMPAGMTTPSLHQMQKSIAEHVMHVPIYELAFIWGVGPRVEESGASLIPGFAYSAPFEDLKLKK